MRIASIIALAALTIIGSVHAESLAEKYAAYGNLIVSKFATAPFPHPERANGHNYKTNFYSAAEHYSDSTVAMFIPKGFRAGKTIDFVVHFHGWGNNVAHALDHYRLIDQFAASDRNAILIVPQGPYNASDTFDGKLEDTNGFARFMTETLTVLDKNGAVHKPKLGKIILSGHSGGYGVISSIVERGGISDHVEEVWLFDALYGRTEKFVKWFSSDAAARFIDIYTDHGGTKEETENLMADLKKQSIPFFSSEENAATPADLQHNKLIFLHTDNVHDIVMQHNDTFLNFLRTSHLSAIPHQQHATATPRLSE